MHCIYPSISINYWQGLTELRSAILPAVATNIFSSSKSRQDSISFFKTKQQEFIHPLILSPTHETKLTKIQKNRVCFPSCSSWPNELSNWPFKKSNQKSVKPTTQKPNNRYHRIKTKYVPRAMTLFWNRQAFRFCHLSAWMGPWNGRRYITGCFTKRTLSINFWIFITSCDDPGMFDEQYTACLKWPDFRENRFCPALHVYCGCALPLFRLFTSILQSANPKWFTIKVISSTVTLNVFK